MFDPLLTLQQGSSSDVVKELGLLGIVLSDVNVLVGLQCTGVNVVGAGSAGW